MATAGKQQGPNPEDERVVAIAIGASQKTGESVILREWDVSGERMANMIERSTLVRPK